MVGGSSKVTQGNQLVNDVGANFDKKYFDASRMPRDSKFKKFYYQAHTNNFKEQ